MTNDRVNIVNGGYLHRYQRHLLVLNCSFVACICMQFGTRLQVDAGQIRTLGLRADRWLAISSNVASLPLDVMAL